MTLFKDMPIRRKLRRILFLISGVVLLVTCIAFFVYEVYAFRNTTEEKLSTIGKIIAANSTAALAFSDTGDAAEILAVLKTEPHITAAALYSSDGTLFAQYHSGKDKMVLPVQPGSHQYQFVKNHLEGFQPVMLDSNQLGTLYLKSGLGEMYERLKLYFIIVALVMLLSFSLAYLLSKFLQKSISNPVLNLAGTVKDISNHQNYSVRAIKAGNDEVGFLTDAFNNMLDQIEQKNHALQEQQRQEQVNIITTTLDAQEKERNLIGQELHDNVNQLLVGAKLFLSMIKEDREKNKELISLGMNSVQQAINENRKIAHALVAPDFETMILSGLIADLLENMLKLSGIETTLDAVNFDEDHLEEEQKLAAYRIAQEQCANIIKHAQARHADVYMATEDDVFKMIIADDGVGIGSGNTSNGIGLKNIKSRLSIFDGSANITTAPGEGFTLEIIMPLKKSISLA